MMYGKVSELAGTEREARGVGWKSRRFLLAGDGLPFSVHETTVAAGTELWLRYRNHSETVYCLRGRASLEVVSESRTLVLAPGVFYSVGIGEEHILRTLRETTFLCVFQPALIGGEEAE